MVTKRHFFSQSACMPKGVCALLCRVIVVDVRHNMVDLYLYRRHIFNFQVKTVQSMHKI